MTVREHLKTRPLLFDGAMGTYYASRRRSAQQDCERANLNDAQEIAAIHRAYRDAGCDAIKTNTFAANRQNFGAECESIVRAGVSIARENAEGAFIFADIGPVESENPGEEYAYLAELFLSQGVENFLFETQSRAAGLLEAAAYIKTRCPKAFVIISFAAQPDGFTRSGASALALLRAVSADKYVDAAGLNCVCGARHMAKLIGKAAPQRGMLSAMPNAAYPTVRGNRVYYDGDPEYFAAQIVELHERGAQILGGCCGTTPAYMAAAAKALDGRRVSPFVRVGPPPSKACEDAREQTTEADNETVHSEGSTFLADLCDPAKRPVAVELDPPQNADVSRFLSGVNELMQAGVDMITIADCPIARARMDSSLLACKLRREMHVEVMPHMTCRDRNLNATQALLLGLCVEDVHNVLIVTGDPIPSAGRDEVKSVYNFNSRQLIRFIRELGGALERPFCVFAALNVNARNFDVQLELAMEKEESGACGFFTQPVLTQRALENLRRAKETLSGKLAGGILPVVSQKNARFLNAEVPGIAIDDRIVSLYAGADRERGEELGVRVSREIARAMMGMVDGYYLMTPFGRTSLMASIMRAMREDGTLA